MHCIQGFLHAYNFSFGNITLKSTYQIYYSELSHKDKQKNN